MRSFLTLVKFEYIKLIKSKFNLIFIAALFLIMMIISYTSIQNNYYDYSTQDGWESYQGLQAIDIISEIAKSSTGEIDEEWIGQFYDDMQNDSSKSSDNIVKYGNLYSIYYSIMALYTDENTDIDQHGNYILEPISRDKFIENFDEDFKIVCKTYLGFNNFDEDKNLYFENEIDQLQNPIYFGYTSGYSFFFTQQQIFAVMILILISILSANIFSNEYTIKTDYLLICSKNGKKYAALAKISAIFSLSVFIYLIITFIHLLIAGMVYGLSDINTPYLLSTVFGESFNDTSVLNVLVIKILISILACLTFSAFGAMISQLNKNQIATILILLFVALIPIVTDRTASQPLTDSITNILSLFPAWAQFDNKLFGNNIYMIGDIKLTGITVIPVLYGLLIALFSTITCVSFRKHQVN